MESMLTLSDAKARLSEIVERAVNGDEYVVTRMGKPVLLWSRASTALVLATLVLVQAAWTAQAPQEGPVAEERWAETLHFVRETFPDVPQLSTERLAELLEEDTDVVLLDARSQEEFATSHLQGAIRATSVRAARRALVEARGAKPIIVVYCSVGYRSSRLAQRLQARGVENVFNLEGSLFKWANEGRPVYTGSEPVRTVHPFDEDWGELLHPSRHPQ